MESNSLFEGYIQLVYEQYTITAKILFRKIIFGRPKFPSLEFFGNNMKKNSIIVNTSRGGIINEKDLDEALNKEFIFGAGLDVFEKEPPDITNPLLKNKKVLLSVKVELPL